MEQKTFTFNGVTEDQFAEAAQTVVSYFNGIADAPITPEKEIAMITCAIHCMMIDHAHNRFIDKLQELKSAIEARVANEENIASQHIKNS